MQLNDFIVSLHVIDRLLRKVFDFRFQIIEKNNAGTADNERVIKHPC